MNCPRCGAKCWRETVDVGIGEMKGPWGCDECGWSSKPKYRDNDNTTPQGFSFRF